MKRYFHIYVAKKLFNFHNQEIILKFLLFYQLPANRSKLYSLMRKFYSPMGLMMLLNKLFLTLLGDVIFYINIYTQSFFQYRNKRPIKI